MTKELVVSANRHETRVAIVEDDQVVEVYHQRENEYSLAGSIHKGRVTRVLPGMQSAFVDIGLERDAFLYVSDFFEDNDEYDKIVTSVEDKILKLERTPAGAAAAPAAEGAAPAPDDAASDAPAAEAGAAEPPAATSAAPPSPMGSPAPSMGGDPRRDDRHDDRRDDRRGGRRGRRRRGQKSGGGRGLPDSKFYSPRPESEHRHSEPIAAQERAPEADAGDFLVLPGESLAKHHRSAEAEELDNLAEPLEGAESEDLAGEVGEAAEGGAEDQEANTPALEAEHHGAAAEAVEAVRETEVAGEEPEGEEPEEEPVVEAAQQAAPEAIAELETEVEPVEVREATVEVLEVDVPESEAAELSEAETAEALVEALESPLDDGAESGTEAEIVDGEAPIVEEEGPEPARIPTSLTAQMREQGPRFMHRVSRRMRRRGGRGGQQEGGRGGQQESGRGGPEGGRTPHEGRGGEQPARTQERTVQAPRPQAEGRPAGTSISDLLKEGQEIIVQIAKEPLGQKGARITSHIALPGRFLVYMPTVDHIGVSRKIPTEEERHRLKRILLAHRTGIPGGYIVRTAGEGRSEDELRADMMFLYNLWLDMRQKAERRPAPMLIHHDLNVVERVLRDQLTSAFKSIWVDNEEVYESVLRFVQRFQPALVNRVKLYTRPTPVFDEFGITGELEKALRPKVWLKSGGHIVINQTEALVAIDINTGKYVGKSNRLEDTIVKTNTDAIREIVRQIRLRDLGGIIVVDFIDMDERKNRQKVMQALEEAMRADRAPYKILQFNDFGLVAITRKRVKQSLERTLCMPCPYCEGAGYVKSPQTVIGEILQEAHKIARAIEGKDVLLRAAPEVAKLLKSNQNTYLQELEEILGRTVIVKSDHQLHQEKFDLA